MSANKIKALVTGGNGFLGMAIIRRLLDHGDHVCSFHRRECEPLEQLGVDTRLGDLSDKESVTNVVEGCDIVFHVAARAGVWGRYDDYYQSNVIGTKNIIDACRTYKISRLVYTSTPSVVFDGHDEDNINESLPYPAKTYNAYQKTKAIAEQMVLAANGKDLATVAIRPHLIWGPNDPHLVPRIIERARAGKLKLVGNRENKVDSTYIDNAAQAHIQAAERLTIGGNYAGKAYFISNGEPMTMKDLINRILKAAQLPPVTKSVPGPVAYAAGAFLEFVYGLLRIEREPIMTRFVARQLSTSHWFDLSAAKQDLGYHPQVTIDEGMQRLEEWLNTDACG